jgi:methyl-accepting chemotaxis protein
MLHCLQVQKKVKDGYPLSSSKNIDKTFLDYIFSSDYNIDKALNEKYIIDDRYFSKAYYLKDYKGNNVGVAILASESSYIEKAADSAAAGLRFQLIVIAVAGVILFFFIMLTIKSAVIKPIENLKEVANELTSGETSLSKRLEIFTNDEIGEAVRELNLFLDKVEALALDAEQKSREAQTAKEEADKNLKKSELYIELADVFIDGSTKDSHNMQTSLINNIDSIKNINEINDKNEVIVQDVSKIPMRL